MEIKGATTRDYERQTHQRIMADFLRAVEMITPKKAEEILVEKGDRQILDVIRDAKEARDKKWEGTIRCAKCGVERPESQYDCKCGYSLGGD